MKQRYLVCWICNSGIINIECTIQYECGHREAWLVVCASPQTNTEQMEMIRDCEISRNEMRLSLVSVWRMLHEIKTIQFWESHHFFSLSSLIGKNKGKCKVYPQQNNLRAQAPIKWWKLQNFACLFVDIVLWFMLSFLRDILALMRFFL